MLAEIHHRDGIFKVDFLSPIDISIPLRSGRENVNAFHLPPLKREAFRIGTFVGDVNEGGACNVFNIAFNPHGNGTHTECVGHISREFYSINDCLKKFFFTAVLVSIAPSRQEEDRIITLAQLQAALNNRKAEALIIRTLPNPADKKERQYSGTNPAYLDPTAAKWVRESGFEHLLLDLPSVDREEDGGKLLAHKAFWNHPESPRMSSTITELIYVPDSVVDGYYFLNLQISSFVNDASPSKPLLFKIIS